MFNLYKQKKKKSETKKTIENPFFTGTEQEFKRYIGGFLRNLVQQITKKYKKEVGSCEHCGTKDKLESAHKHGRNRTDLIDSILSKFKKGDLYHVNLLEFENSFRNEHDQIEDTILILCRSCHTKYDKKEVTSYAKTNIPRVKNTILNNNFQKLDRIQMWANKPNQYNHKIIRAYLELSKKGDVDLNKLERKCSDKNHRPELFVPRFKGNFASMKTDKGNAHGKVFYEIGNYVYVYPEALTKIKNYFTY
jgi:hypothetical protein